MSKRILIVEDEESIADLEKDYLELSGFEVEVANDGEIGLKKGLEGEFDLIILDLMLPGIDGYQVCREIRHTSDVPIIMLSAKGETFDKVLGLELGADDYMTKPFSPKVLIAKVKALLKRTSEDTYSSLNEYDGLTINKLSHEVKINDEIINLSPKEFELLCYLADNEGIALSRDTILDNVWGLDYYGDLRTVDTNIKRLREKLGEKASYIITVRGSGYRFEAKN